MSGGSALKTHTRVCGEYIQQCTSWRRTSKDKAGWVGGAHLALIRQKTRLCLKVLGGQPHQLGLHAILWGCVGEVEGNELVLATERVCCSHKNDRVGM